MALQTCSGQPADEVWHTLAMLIRNLCRPEVPLLSCMGPLRLQDGSTQSALTGPWEPASAARKTQAEDGLRRPDPPGGSGDGWGGGPRFNGSDAPSRGLRGWRDEERSVAPAPRRAAPAGNRCCRI